MFYNNVTILKLKKKDNVFTIVEFSYLVMHKYDHVIWDFIDIFI